MKNHFLFLLLFTFTFSLNAKVKKILVTGSDDTFMKENHTQPIVDLINSHPSLQAYYFDYDTVLSGTFIFNQYDGFVVTEAGGSSTVAPIYDYIKGMPCVNMKTYALQYGKSGWKWVNNTSFPSDFVTLSPNTLWDSANAALETEVKVLNDAEDFPIFDGVFEAGDVFNLFDGCWRSGAHFQAISFENSDSIDVADNAYPVLQSIKMDSSIGLPAGASSSIMWLIDENGPNARNVIWGIHSQFADATPEFKGILLNSILWTLDLECDAFTYTPVNEECTKTITTYVPKNVIVFDTTYVTYNDSISNGTLEFSVKNGTDVLTDITVYNSPGNDKLIIFCGANYASISDYTVKIADAYDLSNVIYESTVSQQVLEVSYLLFKKEGQYLLQIYDSSQDLIDTKIINLR